MLAAVVVAPSASLLGLVGFAHAGALHSFVDASKLAFLSLGINVVGC